MACALHPGPPLYANLPSSLIACQAPLLTISEMMALKISSSSGVHLFCTCVLARQPTRTKASKVNDVYTTLTGLPSSLVGDYFLPAFAFLVGDELCSSLPSSDEMRGF